MDKFKLREIALLESLFNRDTRTLWEMGHWKAADEVLALRNKVMNNLELED